MEKIIITRQPFGEKYCIGYIERSLSSPKRLLDMRKIISPLKSTFLSDFINILFISFFFVGCGSQNGDEPAPDAISLELVAEGLTSPVTLVEPPDNSGRLFIVDQIGVIRIVTSDGNLLEEPFLDLSEVNLNGGYDERGLLGLAFHPNYAENGRFFVYYSAPLRAEAPDGFNHTSHISEFQVSESNPNIADPSSEQILLQIDQPQSNHNGGTLAFGPNDGYPYISLGDGGGANDVGTGHVEDGYEANPGGNGQDITQNFLGTILRIDVDSGNPYAIPPDNPFVDGEGLDEIYAYGFRNPYRFSFDMGGNHDLLVGDAGQELWEEVSLVTSGGNYGWNVKEGTHCFDAENPTQVPNECPDTVGEGHPRTSDPLIDPVIEFRNSKHPEGGLGLTVVGGYVYRGNLLPPLDGQYLFAVWSESTGSASGAIFSAEPQSSGLWDFERLNFADRPALQHYVLGFGQDSEGEVYILTTDNTGPSGNTGRVYKLIIAN
jgi:glucose/arabinose dehydrogenase